MSNLVEKVAKAIRSNETVMSSRHIEARAAIAIVVEEAAKVAEGIPAFKLDAPFAAKQTSQKIAAAIRALATPRQP